MAGNARGLVLPTWTPTIDNAVLLLSFPFAWVADRFPFLINDGKIWVFAGTEAGVDYPALDQPDDGSYTGAGAVASYQLGHPPVSFVVTAGQPYTIVFTDSNTNDDDPSDAPYTLDLSPLYAAMAVCGGVDNPPNPPAEDGPFAIKVVDGNLVLTPDFLGALQSGTGISIDFSNPLKPVISATSPGAVDSVTGNLVDNTDPTNPTVNGLKSIVQGAGFLVDDTDGANPVGSLDPKFAFSGSMYSVGINGLYTYQQGIAQIIEWTDRGHLGAGIHLNVDQKTLEGDNEGIFLIVSRFDLQPVNNTTSVELAPVNIVNKLFGDFFIANAPQLQGVDCQTPGIWVVYFTAGWSFQLRATITGGTGDEGVGDGNIAIVQLSGPLQ